MTNNDTQERLDGLTKEEEAVKNLVDTLSV
jgi:hypothetical protein